MELENKARVTAMIVMAVASIGTPLTKAQHSRCFHQLPLHKDENHDDNYVDIKAIYNTIVHNCKPNSVVFIIDVVGDTKAVKELVYNLTSIGVQDTHLLTFEFHQDEDVGDLKAFQNDLSRMRDFIRRVYIENQVKYFVLIVKRLVEIMESVESILGGRGESFDGRLMVFQHQTKWTIVTWDVEQQNQLSIFLKRSILDHVAVLQIYQLTNSKAFGVRKALTLMWREGRQRELSVINNKDRKRHIKARANTTSSTSCMTYFPNIQYKMNGRILTIGPKVFQSEYLYYGKSEKTGRFEYQGIFMDAWNLASNMSNFTYKFMNDRSYFSKISWNDYMLLLNNGSMEVGLSTWSLLNKNIFELTFCFPIGFDSVVGIYRKHYHHILHESMVFVRPFPNIVYFWVVASAVFTSMLYLLVFLYAYQPPSSTQIIDLQFLRNFGQREINPMSLNNATDNENGNAISLYQRMLNMMRNYFDIAGAFLVASLNQSYMPHPQQAALRLIVVFWSIGMFLFCAFHSSTITAQVVKPSISSPFTSFTDLQKNSSYTCTTVKDSIIDNMLSWNLTTKINDICGFKDNIKIIGTGKDDGCIADHLARIPDETVFIYYRSFIHRWIHADQKRLHDFVMLKDELFSTDVSWVLPWRSELKKTLDKSVMKLIQAGYLDKSTINYTINRNKKRVKAAADNQPIMKVADLAFLAVTTLCCIVFSLIILRIEVYIACQL